MNLERTPSTRECGVVGDHPIVAALTRKLSILAHDELLILRSIHRKLDGLGQPRRSSGTGRPWGGALLG
jgi:hypothetical protein